MKSKVKKPAEPGKRVQRPLTTADLKAIAGGSDGAIWGLDGSQWG